MTDDAEIQGSRHRKAKEMATTSLLIASGVRCVPNWIVVGR